MEFCDGFFHLFWLLGTKDFRTTPLMIIA